jgi:hypothetical protein
VLAVAVRLFTANEAKAHSARASDVVARCAELDATRAQSIRALLPFFATLKTHESLSTLLVGARFAGADVLEHRCGIAGVVVTGHTCGVFAFPAAAEYQHVGLAHSLPYTDKLATKLSCRSRCSVVFFGRTLDHVLTVDASVGLSPILDLFAFISFDEVFRDDVVELAWMKRSSPFGWILMLELECLVEHFPHAWRTDWAAFNVGAGVVAEVLAAYLAVPQRSHFESGWLPRSLCGLVAVIHLGNQKMPTLVA